MAGTPQVDYDAWLSALGPDRIRAMFTDRGCTQVLVKRLASRQDNDKNQIYVGKDLGELAKIPSGDVVGTRTDSRKSGAPGTTKFTAAVDLVWLAPRGDSPAPQAKLIYYPQYPEVRLSGLVLGSPDPPRSLYVRRQRGQESGRHLLIGLNPEGERVWALLLPPESVASRGIIEEATEPYGVFRIWELAKSAVVSTRDELTTRLAEIHDLGWVPGQRLKLGALVPYRAPNAGGYTLEALLGVSPNGRGEPDYLGWEIKGHSVRNLERHAAGALTLMTPQPTGGVYRDGVQDFLRTYGYQKEGRAWRFDFTGRHFAGGGPAGRAGTRLEIRGWDGMKGIEPDGAIVLLGKGGETAASWAFTGLMTHWKRKHAQACYVPYVSRTGVDGSEFRFGAEVLLGENTTFLHLLRGFGDKVVYYDPGLNMKLQGERWVTKERAQFRVAFKNLPNLYPTIEILDVRPAGGPTDRSRIDLQHDGHGVSVSLERVFQ